MESITSILSWTVFPKKWPIKSKIFVFSEQIRIFFNMLLRPQDTLIGGRVFHECHTARRMVVVREKGTKMPADLGGMIYLTIESRADWRKTARDVLEALRKQVSDEI